MAGVAASLGMLALIAGGLAGSASVGAAPSRPAVQPLAPCILALPNQALAYFTAASRRASPPAPIIDLRHGGGSNPHEIIDRFADEADSRDLILLAPASTGVTWDSVRRAYRVTMLGSSGKLDGFYEFKETPDSLRVEAAIAELRKHVTFDRARSVLAGFSDGAGFALALGLSSDHPFAAVMAFSPGVWIPVAKRARGRVALVAHGRGDRRLLYDFTSEVILQGLKRQDAEVIFRPFDGGHDIPDLVLTEFLDHSFGARHRPLVHRDSRRTANCEDRRGG